MVSTPSKQKANGKKGPTMWPSFSRLFFRICRLLFAVLEESCFFCSWKKLGECLLFCRFQCVELNDSFTQKVSKSLSLTKVLKPSKVRLEYIPLYTVWNHSLSPVLTTVVKYGARQFGESRNMCAFRLLIGRTTVFV